MALVQHWYERDINTSNCGWATMDRTNSENCLWLINYFEHLLHRNCQGLSPEKSQKNKKAATKIFQLPNVFRFIHNHSIWNANKYFQHDLTNFFSSPHIRQVTPEVPYLLYRKYKAASPPEQTQNADINYMSIEKHNTRSRIHRKDHKSLLANIFIQLSATQFKFTIYGIIDAPYFKLGI